MRVISYVLRKNNDKFVLRRYIFVDNKLYSSYWVNTYYTFKDAEFYMSNILEIAKDSKLLSNTRCTNIWEIAYVG